MAKLFIKINKEYGLPKSKFEYFEIDAFKKHLNAIQKEIKVEFKNLE